MRFGYAGMALLAMIPPLFKYLMSATAKTIITAKATTKKTPLS
jgi:hypothetical protein